MLAVGLALIGLGFFNKPSYAWFIAGVLMSGVGFIGVRGSSFASRLSAVFAGLVSIILSYVFLIYPEYKGDEIIRTFVKQGAPYFTQASQIHAAGRHNASLEYYLHRPVISHPSALEAYEQAGSNDAIIITSRDKKPVDVSTIPIQPLLDLKKRDVKAILYIKQ